MNRDTQNYKNKQKKKVIMVKLPCILSRYCVKEDKKEKKEKKKRKIRKKNDKRRFHTNRGEKRYENYRLLLR